MPNILMYCPTTGNATLRVHGRVYTGVVGTPTVVPDFDAVRLEANGWIRVGQTGATTARPATPYTGQFWEDTTLNIDIVWDGKTWRNSVTGASV